MSDDRILIRDLLLRCVIGVHDWERKDRQDVLVQVALGTDTRAAAASDDIADAVDYRALTKDILAMAEDSDFHLVEALAEAIADLCLRDSAVRRAEVTVEKPGALRFARSVGVTIVRDAADGV